MIGDDAEVVQLLVGRAQQPLICMVLFQDPGYFLVFLNIENNPIMPDLLCTRRTI